MKLDEYYPLLAEWCNGRSPSTRGRLSCGSRRLSHKESRLTNASRSGFVTALRDDSNQRVLFLIPGYESVLGYGTCHDYDFRKITHRELPQWVWDPQVGCSNRVMRPNRHWQKTWPCIAVPWNTFLLSGGHLPDTDVVHQATLAEHKRLQYAASKCAVRSSHTTGYLQRYNPELAHVSYRTHWMIINHAKFIEPLNELRAVYGLDPLPELTAKGGIPFPLLENLRQLAAAS